MPPSEPPVGCGSLLTVGTSGFLGTPRCRYLFCVSWGSMSTFLPSCGDKQRAGRSPSLPHTFVFEAWCLQSGAVKRGTHTLAIGLSQSRRHHTHRKRTAPEVLREARPCQSLRAHAGPFGRGKALPEPLQPLAQGDRVSLLRDRPRGCPTALDMPFCRRTQDLYEVLRLPFSKDAISIRNLADGSNWALAVSGKKKTLKSYSVPGSS